MKHTKQLKNAYSTPIAGTCSREYYRYLGYKKDFTLPSHAMRANAIAALFEETTAYVYPYDRIIGSIRPLWTEADEVERKTAQNICASFGERDFRTNSDHYAPDYVRIVNHGIPGLLTEIAQSEQRHANDPEKLSYLASMKKTILAFRTMILHYAEAADALAETETEEELIQNLHTAAANCRAIADHAPASFMEGLQLIWLCHTAFLYEGRYAMALGRMDQYLYPLYKADLDKGILSHEDAVELLENTFIKFYESRALGNGTDVVNIAVGGTNAAGECEVNDLSFCVVEAVGNCNIPGPNLSARISPKTPDAFLDACLKVIGTGLGYPALMNDEINMAALERMGYAHEDVCQYSMVGCIENFITGMQPPWSDGRFDTPRFFEYIFNRGRGIFQPSIGIDQGDVSEITSMDEFMRRFEEQIALGADQYYLNFRNYNERLNPASFRQPFLSCFCRDCIGRGLDINEGGAIYPSVHGAAVMGIGTVADSLAAIEKVVFMEHTATLEEIGNAMRANFEGYDELRATLLAAPKYGNNDDFVDKYAVWYVDYVSSLFDRYRTWDGGRYYIAMAANTSNIWAGQLISATPDGRLAGEPLSDAASPTYGRDKKGVTSTVLSVTKPDYTKVACGTVINQKFSPSMFNEEKRPKLLALVKKYLELGGQEMQINATSREVLMDAMEHPDNYRDLVVRVSGFSAYYIHLQRSVQLDILNRTQQG